MHFLNDVYNTGSELPHWTFISYDAVMWLINNMDGINTDSRAIEVFNVCVHMIRYIFLL